MSSSSSSFRGRRFHVGRQPVVVDIGCSCRKPKLFSLLDLSRLNNHVSSKSSRNSSESTCSLTTTITNSTFSPCNDTTSSSSSSSYASPNKKKKKKKKKAAVARKQQQQQEKKKKKAGLMAEESVAVEKESSDPYLDFKDSMLQMIVEKEIYEWDELRELLDLFLSLNSPYHHHLILRAFAEIWEGLFSPPPPPPPPPPRSFSPATTRH